MTDPTAPLLRPSARTILDAAERIPVPDDMPLGMLRRLELAAAFRALVNEEGRKTPGGGLIVSGDDILDIANELYP